MKTMEKECKDMSEPPESKSFRSKFEKFKKTFIFSAIETVVVAVILAFLIQHFIIQAFVIPTGSMIGTLLPKDRILATKYYYNYWNYKRRDIIIFKYPEDPDKEFIKRLIAIPGDIVEFKVDKELSSFDTKYYDLYINGKKQIEPYIIAYAILNDGDKVNEYGQIVDKDGNIVNEFSRQIITGWDLKKYPEKYKNKRMIQIREKTKSMVGFAEQNGVAINYCHRRIDGKTCTELIADSKYFYKDLVELNGYKDDPIFKDYDTFFNYFKEHPTEVIPIKKIRIPEGRLYVLGDNRNNSLDSRYWGYINIDKFLDGKAFLVYWNLHRFKLINPLNIFGK